MHQAVSGGGEVTRICPDPFHGKPFPILEISRLSADINAVLRGYISLREPEPEPWHRCLLCWFVALFPGHGRCRHGYLRPDCSCYDC